MMVPDAFESLLRPSSPQDPPARFVLELYQRLEAELATAEPPTDESGLMGAPSRAVAPATPCLVVRGAARAISFYEETFGATELPGRRTTPEGDIAHTEFVISGSRFALADEDSEWNRSPHSLGGSPVPIHLTVEDADAVFNRAVAGGAQVVMPLADQDYGFRAGRVADPFGHLWSISTPLEE
jgi:PhnB protein